MFTYSCNLTFPNMFLLNFLDVLVSYICVVVACIQNLIVRYFEGMYMYRKSLSCFEFFAVSNEDLS